MKQKTFFFKKKVILVKLECTEFKFQLENVNITQYFQGGGGGNVRYIYK
jgi:hypothetical protein